MAKKKSVKKSVKRAKKKSVKPPVNYGHPGILGRTFNKVIALTLLSIHHYDEETKDGYQRDLIELWVKVLSRTWCDALCGVLNVAMRPDGSFWIVDGQQRAEAMRILGIRKVQCRVIPVDGELATEAWLFRGFNKDRKSISAIHMYRVSLACKLPEAIIVNDVADALGYAIVGKGKNKGDGVIACPGKMLSLAKRDAPVFTKAMEAAAGIYAGVGCIDNRILNGLFHLEKYFAEYSWPEGTKQESVTDMRNLVVWRTAGDDAIFAAMVAAKKGSRDANNTIRPQVNGLIAILNEDLEGRGPGKARPVLHELIPKHKKR